MSNKRQRGSFFSLLELLLVLIIIAFLSYKALNFYFKKPSLDKETEQAVSSQGIDTTNYQTTIDSVKAKVADINKQILSREKELEKVQ